MEIFSFKSLGEFPNLVHGISTTELGNMSFRWGKDKAEVRNNRLNFLTKLGVVPAHVTSSELLHGPTVLDVNEQDWGKGVLDTLSYPQGDVLVTGKKEVFLFMIVADCLALFFFEPVKGVCALAHAGWRGVDQQVPKVTVEHMVKRYGCNPKDIRVGMSPALQAQSYLFSKNQPIEQLNDPSWQPYIRDIGEHYSIDWTSYAYSQLLEAGILPPHIERSTIDTRQSNLFYSHRRSVETGEPEARFGCLLGLRAL